MDTLFGMSPGGAWGCPLDDDPQAVAPAANTMHVIRPFVANIASS
jgi:hypothetical protein